jgi:D-alanine-D-alanine ligase
VKVVVAFHREPRGATPDSDAEARGDIADVAARIEQALVATGHAALRQAVSEDVATDVARIVEQRPDVVFNLCEALAGDPRLEPALPLLLDAHGIAYTGSAGPVLGLAAHKPWANAVLRDHGVRTPEGITVGEGARADALPPFPLIVKPAREDGSVGIEGDSVVHDPVALGRAVERLRARHPGPVLIERFIVGRELHVSLLGALDAEPETLTPMEVDFGPMASGRPRVLTYDGKWREGSADALDVRFVPCEALSPTLAERVRRTALATFRALELRDYARIDLRLDDAGEPWVIDVNPNCDLSDETGGLAHAARCSGVGYDALIARIAGLAGRRTLTRRSSRAAGAAPAAAPGE